MEEFDLYNDDRVLLGRTQTRGTKCNKGENRLVVHVCVFNSKGEMLIQQRQSNKRPYPDMWDFSVGGGVLAGENSRQGAHRELLEELGVDYDFFNERAFITINFDNGFNDFYFLNMDINLADLKLQEEEVKAVKWVSREELLRMRECGEFIPYYESFLSAIFEMKQHRGLYK